MSNAEIQNQNHEQKVSSLREGTVIDHLSPGMALKALEFLGIPVHHAALLGINLRSTKFGRKDILKLESVVLTPDQVRRLAIFGSEVTVATIKDFEVVDKVSVDLPEQFSGILRCPNPSCITNHDRLETRFNVEAHAPDTTLRCHYCERRIAKDEFVFA